MAVGGAIRTCSVFIGVCKRRRQIGERAVLGRVGENGGIVVLCNSKKVRIHGSSINGISVCYGLRTGYRVFKMGGSCGGHGGLSVTMQIGVLYPGGEIRNCGWECIR